jgi:hypothetical protein
VGRDRQRLVRYRETRGERESSDERDRWRERERERERVEAPALGLEQDKAQATGFYGVRSQLWVHPLNLNSKLLYTTTRGYSN